MSPAHLARVGGPRGATRAAVPVAAAAIPGFELLRKTALAKNAAQRAQPAKSVLVRQAGGAGSKLRGVSKGLSAAKTGAAGRAAQELGRRKTGSAPLKGLAGKDAAALKGALASKRSALAKAGSPTKSVLVRQAAGPGSKLPGVSKELSAVKSGASGRLAQELGQVKKGAAPIKGVAGKDAAAVKSFLASKRSVALKATAPTKSVLVRDAGLAGQKAKLAKSGLSSRLGPVTKSPHLAKTAQEATRLAGSEDVQKAARVGRLLRAFR